MKKLVLNAVATVAVGVGFCAPVWAQQQQQRQPVEHEESCSDQLGYLRRVFPEQIAAIDDSHRVWITEICHEFSLMRSDGNAAGLRDDIASNPVLAKALQSRSFTANDVFAVRMMGDDTINLYVHHFSEYR